MGSGMAMGPSGTPPGCRRLGARIRGYRRRAPQPPATVWQRLRRLLGRASRLCLENGRCDRDVLRCCGRGRPRSWVWSPLPSGTSSRNTTVCRHRLLNSLRLAGRQKLTGEPKRTLGATTLNVRNEASQAPTQNAAEAIAAKPKEISVSKGCTPPGHQLAIRGL